MDGRWDEIKAKAWLILKPAIVAMIVALLVSMGVQMSQAPDLQAAGISHFSSVYSSGDVEAVDDLIAGDDVTVTDDVTCVDLTATGTLTAVDLVATGDLTLTDDLSADDLSVGVISAESIAASNNITVTGILSVPNWSMLKGYGLMPHATLALTTGYGITPTSNSLIYLADDGAQATGTVTLDATTSIVGGTYLGQLLTVIMTDADGATMTIKNGANVKLPGAGDLALGLNDSATFVWNGTDWITISSVDN